MDITTINATTPGVSRFFADLGVPFPNFNSKDSLEAFKAEQDANFEKALLDFQKIRSIWAKESLKLQQVSSSKKVVEAAVRAQEAIVTELRVSFDEAFELLMVGRAREEVARLLPEAILGDEDSARFVNRQLQMARNYLKMN